MKKSKFEQYLDNEIKMFLGEIEEYHLERIEDEGHWNKDEPMKTAEDVIIVVDDCSFTPDMDLTYLMGRVAMLKDAKNEYQKHLIKINKD